LKSAAKLVQTERKNKFQQVKNREKDYFSLLSEVEIQLNQILFDFSEM